ncbi:HupE/UreJ family protein [cf. Phormidesmis sp. LEGE 11477]|uniref:HupE/UreJ family protein n=1 Tax=cf. Phormidesmis sp. LEGE 11477 TaxID=1828680 RepID=UPI0018815B66|nr:HupE/UreJ family protein [cf. Phormidesmis sp. LEGE 11477]MBE9061372.1 HupE/UreJ family protein [cf. Phormidesmis sp. LEGE 11477]
MKLKNRSTPLILTALAPVLIPVFISAGLLAIASPALAHHPFGGTTPTSWVQGFLSGLGHPIIGPDHFVFTIIVGLLAIRSKPAVVVPMVFLGATLAGTGIHLMELNLPTPEFFISLSVVLFGVIAAYGRQMSLTAIVILSAMAGIFHGYAYGEAVVGAEMTPLLAYLAGFTLIQAAIMAVAFGIAQKLLGPVKRLAWLRYAGFMACGAGGAFLSSLLLG